uniref:protein-tyrosine-phosphatase n=1 Tax=Timema monikensis TaxID=170555 RepID=A0A7R9HJ56_9NEOP|nr:unnamed protein product [Timema monikensis]
MKLTLVAKFSKTLLLQHVGLPVAKRLESTKKINTIFIESEITFNSTSRKDNGTYRCTAVGPQGKSSSTSVLYVRSEPQVNIDFVKAVGAHTIFLNWTLNDGNEPILQYFIQHMKNGTSQWTHYPEHIGGENSNYMIKNLDANTAYQLGLSARNKVGTGSVNILTHWVKTLDKDPSFVPEISVKGVTPNSITIGWLQPPDNVKEHVHYYQLMLKNNHTLKEAIHNAQNLNLFLFVELQPATTYNFKVSACNEYTKCGNWSKEVNGTTMDGESGPPENVSVVCRFDNISRTSFVFVTWLPPLHPYGKIVHYNRVAWVILEGKATFKNSKGVMETAQYDPKIKFVDEKSNSARFDMIPPNTNYTVRVSGVTRSKSRGTEAVMDCQMPPTVPDKDKLSQFIWVKVEEHGRWLLKLFLPRITERNGPICCYRVFIVKLEPSQTVADLPLPEDFPISSYEEVHHSRRGGAYVAEMFESESLTPEVFLGDGQSFNINTTMCHLCVGLRLRPPKTTVAPTHSNNTILPTILLTTQSVENDTLSSADYMFTHLSIPVNASLAIPSLAPSRVRREGHPPPPAVSLPSHHLKMKSETLSQEVELEDLLVYDGQLDTSSNYTGFVEVVVMGVGNTLLPAYSSYFGALNPGPHVLHAAESSQVLTVILQVLCALILVVLVLLAALCFLQRYTKQVAEAQGVEMTLTNTFRHLCRSFRGRHVLVSSNPPDMTPISKSDLTAAYVERHKDSDYGFQHEFELLPDRFPDRSTRHSEARENLYKNRYPDIKAYDQTRIHLSQIDSLVGSDYINANYVIGYKERKKFICAQGNVKDGTCAISAIHSRITSLSSALAGRSNLGSSLPDHLSYYHDNSRGPMDNTVCDFWRMIWEQHLELILMLTNLEEYSKTKCAKYWPDDSEGEKYFGDFTVAHVEEKRYSDYIIRELKLCRACRNGKEMEQRRIVQYHFLVWKDFMAPEHPAGILKFIKRVNEAYSLEKGPILVHCSAGVGRTGTLVALDSLLQQLSEEGQVSIFNTVCDLRHQRNFLVQSLEQQTAPPKAKDYPGQGQKQYIFIYRALMESALFGNTEIKVSELKLYIDKLKKRENGRERCKMEDDFEKIKRVVEANKSCSVGDGEENKPKNRCDLVIPYDRNRVILTPIPGREHSTYINASFIEGYDNSESFIITQDPLESTIEDFWRMVSEQNITTLVMLSDLGDGAKKCLRYWPDDEASYNHIHVKYIQSDCCPYYTRRELNVTNKKTDENLLVTQFQYNGWPTVEGEVPEVTRGLIELVDQTQNHQESIEGSGPITVHCSCGSDRSSIFVALSILVQQLHTEKRVDIFTTTRKLHSQRQGMLQTFRPFYWKITVGGGGGGGDDGDDGDDYGGDDDDGDGDGDDDDDELEWI